MSGPDPFDRDELAGEYALGVLRGAELAGARELVKTDGEFRAAVAEWLGRLAPLLDQVESVDAPPSVWQRVEARLAGAQGEASNVVALKRRVRVWQGAAAAATALAASLAIVLALPREPVAAPPVAQAPTQPPPPMVAMLGDDQETKLVASWDPAGRRLILAVAGDMPDDPARAHELWVIPADGKPRSLGTMQDTERTHVDLADALAELMRQGATIAISVEPRGGSPTGQPTGPVIASGTLEGA
ncbi:anti-sigma factor [Sphingomonas lutea]|uniref:Anti-sigma factor n=1 Tax=Sphingomonas lutea TaxID=1045317 RepID=A0A7G9SJ47_9SPHN|nr:anti-sigma factor [Sphingomonas lutea]QNN67872.1 anti-sigma factor [Sphingomonas lutea]